MYTYAFNLNKAQDLKIFQPRVVSRRAPVDPQEVMGLWEKVGWTGSRGHRAFKPKNSSSYS